MRGCRHPVRAAPRRALRRPAARRRGQPRGDDPAGGGSARLPKLPLRIGAHDFGLRREPPALGEGSRDFLASLSYADDQIDALAERGVIAGAAPARKRGQGKRV